MIRLTNKTYDALNDIVKLALPAIGVFYAALALIWRLPFSEAVVGTIAALTVFLGVILKISQKHFLADESRFDGELSFSEDSENGEFKPLLSIETPFDELVDRDQVVVKVRRV